MAPPPRNSHMQTWVAYDLLPGATFARKDPGNPKPGALGKVHMNFEAEVDLSPNWLCLCAYACGYLHISWN